MKRHWVYALAALIALPCALQAQGDPGWGPVFRVTPFIGVSPGFTQEGIATVFTANGLNDHRYELEHGSSIAFGVNGEYRLWNRFGLVGGLTWSSRGQGRLIDFEDEFVREFEGTTLWMAKAGLAMRLREVKPDLQLRRLNASIHIAPAWIHDSPKTSVFTPGDAATSINHWGLNLGAEAELPLTNERLAFQLALDDWIVFWDEDKYSGRMQGYFQERISNASVAIDPDNSHVVIFRAGLSWRF